MEGNDDDEEGLFAPMILLKRVFVIGNTSTHTQEGVLFLSFFLGVCVVRWSKNVWSIGLSSGQKHFLPFFKNRV